MKSILKSGALLFAVLLGSPALAQSTCCTGPARTPGSTVTPPTPLSNNEALTADLAVDRSKTKVTEEGSKWVLTVRIVNQNGDDCSRGCGRAIIGLPTETKVVSVATTKGGRPASLNWKQCNAYLEVDLPELCPSVPADVVEVTVVVEKSRQKVGQCLPTFSVMVRGEMPDASPENNYWWWKRRCTTGTELGPVSTGP